MKHPYPKPAGVLKKLRYLILLAVLLAGPSAAQYDFTTVPVNLMCAIYDAFVTIAAVLGGLVIVVSGVTWIAAYDNPSKRQGAKSAIIHAVIGLIIVSIAAAIVGGVTLRDSGGASVGSISDIC